MDSEKGQKLAQSLQPGRLRVSWSSLTACAAVLFQPGFPNPGGDQKTGNAHAQEDEDLWNGQLAAQGLEWDGGRYRNRNDEGDDDS